MKDLLIKAAGFIIIFVVAVFIISSMMNKGSTDMTVDMESAALPVVSISFKNGNINKLHGYVQSVDLRKFRPSLTPLNGDRHLKMQGRASDLVMTLKHLISLGSQWCQRQVYVH